MPFGVTVNSLAYPHDVLRSSTRRRTWMSGCPPPPSVCACVGRVLRDQETRLSERKRVRAAPPQNLPSAGCLERSERSQTAGSPFFCLRFFGEAKKRESPAGARPGLPLGACTPHPGLRCAQSACLRKNAGISKSSMPPLLKASTLAAAEVRLRQTLGVAMAP